MFRNIQAPELIIILLIVVLLFGARKLPDTARGLGRSLRIFKAETKGLASEDSDEKPSAAPAPKAVEAPRTEPDAEKAAEGAAEPRVTAAPDTEHTDR